MNLKFGLIFLLSAVVAGFVLLLIGTRMVDSRRPLTGVKIISDAGESFESTFDSALHRLASQNQINKADVEAYIWTSSEELIGFVVEGDGARRLYVDGNELEEMRKPPRAMQKHTFTEGWHKLTLRFNPPREVSQSPLRLLWTLDQLRARGIPFHRSFVKPADLADVKKIEAGLKLRVYGKLFIVLPVFFFLLGLMLQQLRNVLAEAEKPWKPLLVVALFVLLWLRVSGLHYELHEGLHPDERVAKGAIHKIRHESLRPKQLYYSYGYYYISAATESLFAWIHDEEPERHAAQRLVSIAASAGACLLIFLIARNLISFSAGATAAMLYGIAFLPVQLSMFGIIEPTMVFFFLLALYYIIRLQSTSTFKHYLIAGFVAGLAVGIKQTALLLVIPFFCVLFYNHRKQVVSKKVLMKSAVWAIAAAAGYFVLSPFTLLEFASFYRYQMWQLRSLKGEAQTSVFHTQTGFEIVTGALMEGWGAPVLIAALIGLIVMWKRARPALLFLAPVSIIYFWIIITSKATVYHYMLLLSPFIAIFAAMTLMEIQKLMSTRLRIVAPVLLVFLVLLVSLPSLWRLYRLQVILAGPDTRETAVRWCYDNLPHASVVEYEFFGPRFSIPAFIELRRPLFNEQSIIGRGQTVEYYISDHLTERVYTRSTKQDRMYKIQRQWYEGLKKQAQLLKTFEGNRIGEQNLYNPTIKIYKIPGP